MNINLSPDKNTKAIKFMFKKKKLNKYKLN